MATSPPLIAVVDDDAAVRNSLKFSLEIEGFAVRTFVDAEDFLKTGSLQDIQCLIVDQELPGKNGLEFVAGLREHGVTVPALLISGRLTPTVIRQASIAGIPLIEKPLIGNGLVEALRAAVGSRPG